MDSQVVPELSVDTWFNAETPLTLTGLRGQVVVLYAFQMLCPGCVLHGTPLAKRIDEQFSSEGVITIGVHTVFEHHQAMTPISLAAYLHEFRVRFPVAVDRHEDPNGMPMTMQSYGLQGTPSFVLIDRKGHLRHRSFGAIDDLRLGRMIGGLVDET